MTSCATSQFPRPSTEWLAELHLGFGRIGNRTVLRDRRSFGPLRIQKPLYPEGEDICHAIVLHPPAGIAGGDQLRIGIEVDENAHTLLTTPGAGKWYRSAGPQSEQTVSIKVGAGGTAEWLPQESIVFSGAQARMQTVVDLEEGARYIGVETLCLGRRASGERFERGNLRLATDIRLNGQALWHERGLLAGNSPLLQSPIGLAGYSVCSTVLAAGAAIAPELLIACRQVVSKEPEALWGVSALPQLFVGRYLGHSAQAAREWFVELWRFLRPALVQRETTIPRLWST